MRDSDFDSHLNVDQITSAIDSQYIIKEIDIEHLRTKIETPFKVLPGNGISETDAESVANRFNSPIFEYQKFVAGFRSWNSLHYLLTEVGQDRVHRLDSFFNIKKRLWSSALTTISLVFPKNPFIENDFGSPDTIHTLPPLEESSYICLLDYIHSASKAFILVPDIRLEKNEGLTRDLYLEYIDKTVSILADMNSKPIFTPLHIELSNNNLEAILTHYSKMGYCNLWINFDAKSCSGTYASRLRTIHHFIQRKFDPNTVTLYYSHIKKEITPNVQDEKVPASDILTQFYGADFIGTDREPWRYVNIDWDNDDALRETATKHNFSSLEEYREAHVLHKHRIFDPDSYYYYNINRYPGDLSIDAEILLGNNAVNRLYNGLLMSVEIDRTKDVIGETRSVRQYLDTKSACKENPELLDSIIPPERQSDLIEFLGSMI